MFTRHSSTAICAAPRGRQRGVYALEWAIIFPVFFMLLYAIISFGLAFLVRESMQFAAEDGARAALQYQANRDARLLKAKDVVMEKIGWLPATLKPANVNASICRVGMPSNCSPTLTCSLTIDDRCLVRLDFTVSYGKAPLAPSLRMFGINLLAPETLTASASILVDHGGI